MTDPDAANALDEATTTGDTRRRLSSWRIELRVVPVALAVLLMVSAAVAAWLYIGWYRSDQRTGDAVAQTAVDAAAEGIVAILTFTPDTVEDDVAAAKSHLTGDFLSHYEEYTTNVITPAAKDKSVQTTAEVVGAGVAELHPDTARVLLFVNQTVQSKEKPDPAVANSSILVTLTKVGSSWLISKFDPV